MEESMRALIVLFCVLPQLAFASPLRRQMAGKGWDALRRGAIYTPLICSDIASLREH
jgi:hypothetical protein